VRNAHRASKTRVNALMESREGAADGVSTHHPGRARGMVGTARRGRLTHPADLTAGSDQNIENNPMQRNVGPRWRYSAAFRSGQEEKEKGR
jgi:hypothetical protein